MGESVFSAGRPGLPGREPAGIPGRVGPALAALGRHRPGRRGRRHHRDHHRAGGADAALRPRPAPPARCGAPGEAVVERLVGLQRRAPARPARRLPRPEPPGRRDDAGRGGGAAGHPPAGGPPALGRPGRRGPRPRHRAPPRRGHARLLRPAQRQAVVLPPRQPRGLRHLQRHLPGVPRPHRAPRRARAGVGGVPPLRRQPRLGRRRHGRERGVAARSTGPPACTTSTSATRRWSTSRSSRWPAGT